MSIEKASLLLIPSAYKPSKLYSVLPSNGDGDFSFSRASTATRVNKEGLIESVGTEVARLDYTNSTCPCLLLEPQRTNIFLYSEQFENNYWLKANAIISSNQAISPDGQQTADKFYDTASSSSSSHIVFKTITPVVNDKHSFSCFIKKGTLSKAFLAFNAGLAQTVIYNLENGTIQSQGSDVDSSHIEDYGNDWYRCSFTHTHTAATSNFVAYRVGHYNNAVFYAGTGVDYIYIFGAQFEEQSLYTSSYIPTNGSAVTRVVDGCEIANGLENTLNTSEGTLFLDVEVARVSAPSDFERIILTDSTFSDALSIDNYGGNWRVFINANANSLINLNIAPVTANERVKFAIAYSSNQLRISFNGNAITTTSGTFARSTFFNSFRFSDASGANKWQGKIYQTACFNEALSDAELQELTTL